MATRWIDNKIKDIKIALASLIHDNDIKKNNSSLFDYKHLKTNKICKEDHVITIKGKSIEFNIVDFHFDKIKIDDDTLSLGDRTNPVSGFVIIYKDNGSVNYIISRNSDASRVLRYLLNCKTRGRISRNQPELYSDLFIWLISKILNKDSEIDNNDGESLLSIDSLEGIQGDTAGPLNRVSVRGQAITNILSTLSFLLESQSMSKVVINVHTHSHERIELNLKKRYISTGMNEYIGVFGSTISPDNKLIIKSELYLLIYKCIIPLIMQSYSTAIDNGEWDSNNHKKFLCNVADKLKSKINEYMSTMESHYQS